MGASPQPRIQSRSGRFTRSKDLPALLRQRLSPGAPQWVKARSIQPSLLKSSATTPAVGAGMSLLQGVVAWKAPSRGFRYATGDFCQPVTTKSMARSLLMSLARAPTDGAVPARAVSVVQFVNVPLPLLRQRTLPGGGTSAGNSNGAAGLASGKLLQRVTYRSKSPS